MEGLKIVPFGSPGELAAAAAKDFRALLMSRNPQQPFGVALSGGRIARTLFQKLGHQLKDVDWANLHFFWADERCVPASDPESNFNAARECLFEPLQFPLSQVHRIIGEVDPAYASSQAEAEICRMLPMNAKGQPVLDLVFLGLGEDGHIASLFPGEPAEIMDLPKVYRAVIGPKPPPQRITIGFPALGSAREVWILASGPGKLEALNRLKTRDLQIPAGRLVSNRANLIVYEDISQKKF